MLLMIFMMRYSEALRRARAVDATRGTREGFANAAMPPRRLAMPCAAILFAMMLIR